MDTIGKSIDLTAPIERVWRALTNPDEFGAWFRAKLDGPFVVGEVTTGRMTYAGCEHMYWWSKTEEMTPYTLVFSWPHPADPSDVTNYETAPMTRVAFTLEPCGTGTHLHVAETGFEAIPEGQRASAMRDNTRGWDLQLTHIEAHLEG